MASKNASAQHRNTTAQALKDKYANKMPEGFGDSDLVSYRSGTDMAGFYSPRTEGEHIFGTLTKYVERRDPGPNQAAGFIIVILAAPVKGLVFNDDGGDGEEGELQVGDAVGIDIRAAYSMLKEERFEGSKIHLHFVGKKKLPDGRPFWDVNVRASEPKTKAATNPPVGEDGIPF